jgi:hypothetical protein
MTNDQCWFGVQSRVELHVGKLIIRRASQMSIEQTPAIPTQSPVADFLVVPTATLFDDAKLADVFAITEEIFGSKPIVDKMVDPEDPHESPFLVFRVEVRGQHEELIQRHIEWGRRLDSINAGLQYRLSIIPVA